MAPAAFAPYGVTWCSHAAVPPVAVRVSGGPGRASSAPALDRKPALRLWKCGFLRGSATATGSAYPVREMQACTADHRVTCTFPYTSLRTPAFAARATTFT